VSSHPAGDRLPRAFRRFWWGETVSGFGSTVTILALQTLVVVTLGGGATQVGWLNAARWLPYLVLGLVVGALVERVRRCPVMVATDLLRALLLGLVPLASVLGVLDLPLLLLLVVAFGTASLVNDAASMSMVPRLVPRAQLQRAHARLDASGAVAQTAGPAVAGVLIRTVGAPLAVLVDALTYLFSAAVVATLSSVPEPRRAPDRSGARGLVREVAEGARWAYGRSGLARLAVATHVWFAAQALLLVVVAPYAFLQLRLTAFQLGLVFAVAGVGAIVGASVTTTVGARIGGGAAIICAYLVSAAGVLVMAAATAAPPGWAAAGVLAVGQLGHGWAMGLSNSHEMSLRQALTPDALQARTNTTLRSANRAVIVVVSPVAGLGVDRFGFVPGLISGAAVFAVAALLLATSAFRRARVE
jgi:MFS family permease